MHLHPGPECTNESTDLCAPVLSLSGFYCLKHRNMIPSSVSVCTEGCTAFTPKIIIIIIIKNALYRRLHGIHTQDALCQPDLCITELASSRTTGQAAKSNGEAARRSGQAAKLNGQASEVVENQQNRLGTTCVLMQASLCHDVDHAQLVHDCSM